MPLFSLPSTFSAKRQKQVFGLFSVLVVYSMLGFLAAPPLLKKLAQQYVHDQLQLELALTAIELNPLTLALRVDGVRVSQPHGETLVAVHSIYLNASMLMSIWQRRLYVDELAVRQPYINVHINQQGKLNLLQLLPPDDGQHRSTPWQLAQLTVQQARIDLADDSRRQPFRSRFTAFDLQLYNLSSSAGDQGQYQFSADTAQNEHLSWQGRIGLQPLRSEGHLLVRNLQLTTVGAYLAGQIPLTIRRGVLDIDADYRVLMTADQPVVQVSAGHLVARDVQAASQHERPLLPSLARLELQGLHLGWPQLQLQFQNMVLQDLALADSRSETPAIMELGGLTLSHGDWRAQSDSMTLAQIVSRNLVMRDGAQVLLTIPAIAIDHLQARPDHQFINSGRIAINGGDLALQLLANGGNNWQDMLARLSSRWQTPDRQAAAATPPWTYALGELALSRFQLALEDRRQQPVFREPVLIEQLTVNPELDLAKPHALSAQLRLGTGGAIKLAGELQEAPLKINGQLQVSALALPPLAVYVNDLARLRLESGELDIDGRLHFQQQPQLQASFDGMVGVNRFAANDMKLNERFLAWKRLVATGLQWQLTPMRLKIQHVLADQPFSRVIVAPDKTINLEQVVATGNKPSSTQSSSALALAIETVTINNGSMLFADLTLSPQFATGIQSLTGAINGISTSQHSHAVISLAGRVDQYGKALINGSLNPFSPDENTDIAVKFQNVELTTLTPYSAKFAGYRLDKGKLSLDLNYKIQQRQLKASNKIVLNQLTLGDKVDSPDAVSLPLRLAIALLKDADGVIDLDIPLSGSLDDPKFRVGPIVWQAIVNVLTKVATAPFRFIAGLVDGGDDMDSIAFDQGMAVLPADSTARLGKLAQALNRRPALRLEIRGVFDPVHDGESLRRNKYQQALASRPHQGWSELALLEQWYSEQFGIEALQQQRALNLKPVSAGDTLQLAANSYQQALAQALQASQPVAEGELRQLALDRARAIRSQLIDKNQIAESRVFVLEPTADAANDRQQVISKVSVNSD